MVEPFATDEGQLEYRDTLEYVSQLVSGTAAGDDGDLPAEFADFCLMRGMRWSWEQLRATPPYVKQYCRDFLGIVDARNRGTR